MASKARRGKGKTAQVHQRNEPVRRNSHRSCPATPTQAAAHSPGCPTTHGGSTAVSHPSNAITAPTATAWCAATQSTVTAVGTGAAADAPDAMCLGPSLGQPARSAGVHPHPHRPPADQAAHRQPGSLVGRREHDVVQDLRAHRRVSARARVVGPRGEQARPEGHRPTGRASAEGAAGQQRDRVEVGRRLLVRARHQVERLHGHQPSVPPVHLQQTVQRAGRELGVGVEEQQHLARGPTGAEVTGPGLPGPSGRWVGHLHHRGTERAGHGCGRVP